MTSTSISFCFILGVFLLSVSVTTPYGLSTDGILLLSFKYAITSDPLSALETWNYSDETPCSWFGVSCAKIGLSGKPGVLRVTGLALPRSQLSGSISPHLGFIEHLRQLDMSNNFFNGSLPASIFVNAVELQEISLSGNGISGELPKNVGASKSLEVLNLSRNAFSGPLPGGFSSVRVLDLSSNLLNGTLPLDFSGMSLNFLNLSNNRLSGRILPGFATKIPGNATIDLSFNSLSGAIPNAASFLGQKSESFRGNMDLCGKPLKNLCVIPSSHSDPPNVTTTSPAIAVIPKPIDSTQENTSATENRSGLNQSGRGLKSGTIAAIAVADVGGIAILAMVILYVYKSKMRKAMIINETSISKKEQNLPAMTPLNTVAMVDQAEPTKKSVTWSCLPLKGDEASQTATSDSDNDDKRNQHYRQQRYKEGKLVMVDGNTELEMDTLFKASAYILGTSSRSGSIVYRAVLGDGTTFAVRRIGESCVLKTFKEFETQMRAIAKLKHPNLVSLRGFYWGDGEKLLVHDYIANGSLATSCHGKPNASPVNLPLEVRFKIARGVARSIAYLHEKKHVHGNIKPNNILLNHDMEPLISDFGLDSLVSVKPGHSNFTASSSITASFLCPYYPPESTGRLKPNPKWDVYSFGVILLELLTGRALTEIELSQWTGSAGSIAEDKNCVLRLVDTSIRGDLGGKEDSILPCFKLGLSCASFAPRKRPSMKEALRMLENNIPGF